MWGQRRLEEGRRAGALSPGLVGKADQATAELLPPPHSWSPWRRAGEDVHTCVCTCKREERKTHTHSGNQLLTGWCWPTTLSVPLADPSLQRSIPGSPPPLGQLPVREAPHGEVHPRISPLQTWSCITGCQGLRHAPEHPPL